MFIAIFIFLFILLLPLLVIVQLVANRKKLRQMDDLIEEFRKTEFQTEVAKEDAKYALRKRLSVLKSHILADKKSLELANDKMLYL
jgi:hypothetical protein